MNNTTGNFQARLGDKTDSGLLPGGEPSEEIRKNKNPFVTGMGLPEDSTAFFGRGLVMDEILSALKHPDRPRCVTLLGERGIGKTSLLNRIFAALGTEEGLLVIRSGTRGWNEYTPARFFAELHRAIAEILGKEVPDKEVTDKEDPAEPSSVSSSAGGSGGESPPSPVEDYPDVRHLIQRHAGGHRFLLILDEFDALLENPAFDAGFFTNLHDLSNTQALRFGYLLASRRPLTELCERHGQLGTSGFRDIFGMAYVLGLLGEQECSALFGLWQKSLESALPPEQIRDLVERIGAYPALLQQALARGWEDAGRGKAGLGTDGMKEELWAFFGDVWADRPQAEKEVLVRVLGGGSVAEHMLLRDLRSRGLVIRKEGKDRLFAALFGKFVREMSSGDPELSRVLTESRKEPSKGDNGDGPGRGNRLLNMVSRMAKKVGLGGGG